MNRTATISTLRLVPDQWPTWREVRLASLADAPHAYGSTLAAEQAFDEAQWRHRLGPDNGVAVVAMLGDRVVGAVAAYTPPGADAALLVAMWVRPGTRGKGVGDALVGEILAWAAETGWPRVELNVVDDNTAARRLFERNGFVPTGVRAPLESDPAATTEILVRMV